MVSFLFVWDFFGFFFWGVCACYFEGLYTFRSALKCFAMLLKHLRTWTVFFFLNSYYFLQTFKGELTSEGRKSDHQEHCLFWLCICWYKRSACLWGSFWVQHLWMCSSWYMNKCIEEMQCFLYQYICGCNAVEIYVAFAAMWGTHSNSACTEMCMCTYT